MKPAGWIATFACVVVSSCSLDPYRYLTVVDTVSRSPKASDCGACHVEIHREFVQSRHAAAFVAPAFVAATANHAFTDCLGCHAPESIFVEGPPRPRALYPEEGVTCVACHFDGAALAGPAPRSALLEPHPTAREQPLYRSSELCGKCHEGTYREWRESALPDDAPQRTCQECHMRPVERKLTQATDAMSRVLVSFEDEFAGRAHSFRVDAITDLEDCFETRRIDDDQGSRVEILSRVPHLVPTGDFGFRRIDVVIAVLSDDGEVAAESTHTLFKEIGSALRPGERREFLAPAAGPRSPIRLQLLAIRGDSSATLILQRELQP